jgi:hypothetical protein
MLEQEQRACEATAKALLPEPEPEHVASVLELLGFEVENQLQVRRTAYPLGSPAAQEFDASIWGIMRSSAQS